MPSTHTIPSGHPRPDHRLGALCDEDGTRFRVWAPHAHTLRVLLDSGRDLPMAAVGGGIYEAMAGDVGHGARYRIELDGDAFPDPASRYQPGGVHGPSMVVDPGRFTWSDDAWHGTEPTELVIYEIHVGTYTPEGTFDGLRKRLPYLRDLGVTALELMPVADFPGRWNWGYDHAALYAPSRAYGTPDALRRLVDEAHAQGLSVFLDVIYNHLGPDGAYIAAFAPMFTSRHETPWGQAINLDDRHARGVRNFFIGNALMWLTEYHLDGLRLDATHALVDESEPHFLRELNDAVDAITTGPDRIVIAEDHRNDNRLVRPPEEGGYGLDGVWADDFHHQIRNLTAGDDDGYYEDYADTTTQDLATTINQGWFYDGRLSKYSGKPRGTDPSAVAPAQCVICIQNHDQVGNRPTGRRLHHDIPADMYRAVSAILLFAPELPLLFMGQEWAASTPFLFFTDHDEPLGSQVSAGRKEEFKSFAGFKGEVPDPQDAETFERSRLKWEEQDEADHGRILDLYRDLLALRQRLESDAHASSPGPSQLCIRRGDTLLVTALEPGTVKTAEPVSATSQVVLHTNMKKYGGSDRSPFRSDGTIWFDSPGSLVLTI